MTSTVTSTSDLGELRLDDGGDGGKRRLRAMGHDRVAQGVLLVIACLLEQRPGLLGIVRELLPKVDVIPAA